MILHTNLVILLILFPTTVIRSRVADSKMASLNFISNQLPRTVRLMPNKKVTTYPLMVAHITINVNI